MGNVVPPPSPRLPATTENHFTPPWVKWFVDLADYLNKSGGTDGAVPVTKQAQHTVYAGPTSGIPAYPTFRVLDTSDLPSSISTTVTLAKITAGGTNGSLTIVNGLITAVTQPT